MFGIGPQEVVIIVLLLLVVFGPVKAASMARDAGRFANEARRNLDEIKSELMSEEVNEAREGVKEARRSVRRTADEIKSELTFDEGQDGRGRQPSRNARRYPQASDTDAQTDASEKRD